jgi:hypothetical protein
MEKNAELFYVRRDGIYDYHCSLKDYDLKTNIKESAAETAVILSYIRHL